MRSLILAVDRDGDHRDLLDHAGDGVSQEVSAARASLFYAVMAGLMVPGVLLSLGLASLMRQVGIPPAWYYSGLGVHVVWTLPFGFLVMMAVFNRFDAPARGGGARHGRRRMDGVQGDYAAADHAGHRRGRPVRLYAVLRRIRPHHAAVGATQHATARHQCGDDAARATDHLRARHRLDAVLVG